VNVLAKLANQIFLESFPQAENTVKESSGVEAGVIQSKAELPASSSPEILSQIADEVASESGRSIELPKIKPVQSFVYSFLEENRSLFDAKSILLDEVHYPNDYLARNSSETLSKSISGFPGAEYTDVQKDVLNPQIPAPDGEGRAYKKSLSFYDERTSLHPDAFAEKISSVSPVLISNSVAESSIGSFNVDAIRRDFPILNERVNGRQLIWFDNAATTHKPKKVIDRLVYYYEHENSNVHRGAHALAARSTDAYEDARKKVQRFLNAPSPDNIIFVRGATEAINLVAKSWGWQNIHKDDEIIVSWLEHHANIVPWQQLAEEKGAKLRIIPVNDNGELLLNEYEKLFNNKTAFVAVTHVSNALGTITPVAELVQIAHKHGVRILVDGAQAVSHLKVDLQTIDPDFYVFSGHKIFGPTGIGVVYGKFDVLEKTGPWQGGGNMIADVTFEKTIYQNPPSRFEAGTGNIADAVGLGAALDYVNRVGLSNIANYEHQLLQYATEKIKRIPGIRVIGNASEKASVLSFVLDGFKTEEIGQALNKYGIAVRAGHHCAQPILRRLGVESTVRPSFAFYNTCEEIDQLISALWDITSGKIPSIEG
jgi:SufS family cysteine desulfurase